MSSAASAASRVAFLPGAAGAPDFWEPVAQRLGPSWGPTLLSWPGAGDQPHDPRVGSFEQLIELTRSKLGGGRCDLVAQSMGGVVAVGLALSHPETVRRLVLVATSGGIDVAGLGASEWRADYRAAFPGAAAWITEQTVDFTAELPELRAPTLLLWGDRDPISPVAIGQRLAELIDASVLRVIPGGTHDLALEQPDEVAAAIAAHLSVTEGSR
jgi:pimeloyl-ACP methyl ester carboxylesterase